MKRLVSGKKKRRRYFSEVKRDVRGSDRGRFSVVEP